MAVIPFRFTTNSGFTNTLGVDKKVVIRGSNVEDQNHTVTIIGVRDGGTEPIGETLTVSGASAKGKIELMSAYAYEQLTMINFAGTFDGNVTVLQEGAAGIGDIRVDTNPADGVTVTIGLTGFTQAYRFKNTTAAAYDVKIGATAADTAANLKKAINADGLGDGTDYHTGTAANPYFSAAVTSATVTITDRCKSERQLGVVLTQSSTEFTLRSPNDGVDGRTIGEVTAGADQRLGNTQICNSLSEFVYMPLATFKTQSVPIGGKSCTVHYDCANSADTLTIDIEYSTDGSVWVDIPSLQVSDTADNIVEITKNLTLQAEYIRLSVNFSGLSAAVSPNWRAVFG